MAESNGTVPVGTKVDSAMKEFLDEEANRLGVSKAELQRRLLEFYRAGIEDETPCPNCGSAIEIPLTR